MYFPYLRGKQFELLALRAFSQSNPGCESIVPIIEPVKKTTKSLEQAFSTMLECDLKFAVVLNPLDGDFKHPMVSNDIINICPMLKDQKDSWIPAYSYRNNGSKILRLAESYDLKDLMIIFPQSIDFSNIDTNDLLSNDLVRYIVISNDSRSTRAKLNRRNKYVITLKDHFNTRQKNADYADPDDEFFSDDFAFYKDDRLYGYADYTTLSKDFIEGGMLPYAIAIHLTYRNNEDEINVHHFVSDTNFDQSNIKGKFIEAAKKIAPFYEVYNLRSTSAVAELIDRSSSEEKYPGLGYIKKLSILNHLELINHIEH